MATGAANMKYAPIQLSSLKKTLPRHGAQSVNYLQGFWLDLLQKSLSTGYRLVSTSVKKRKINYLSTFKLRWYHLVIAFLIGALIFSSHSGGRVIHSEAPSPAPGIVEVKPLPKLKEASYKPQDVLQLVWVSKLRPPDTYPNGYAAGNCTYGVASRLPIPNDWGNANNWAYAASIEGYTVTNTPTAEAIAQTGGDSYLGHVAVVLSVNPDGSFVIWEENYNGLYSTDTRLTTTAEFPNFIIP